MHTMKQKKNRDREYNMPTLWNFRKQSVWRLYSSIIHKAHIIYFILPLVGLSFVGKLANVCC